VEQGAKDNKQENKTKATTVAFAKNNATYNIQQYAAQSRALIKFTY